MATEECEERSNPTVKEEEDEDDPPLLSARALEALKEFLDEQKQRFSHGEEEEEEEKEAVSLVSEDWRLSQFWYDRETAETVATELKNLSVSTSSPVACIACPTLYAYLKVASFFFHKLLLQFSCFGFYRGAFGCTCHNEKLGFLCFGDID